MVWYQPDKTDVIWTWARTRCPNLGTSMSSCADSARLSVCRWKRSTVKRATWSKASSRCRRSASWRTFMSTPTPTCDSWGATSRRPATLATAASPSTASRPRRTPASFSLWWSNSSPLSRCVAAYWTWVISLTRIGRQRAGEENKKRRNAQPERSPFRAAPATSGAAFSTSPFHGQRIVRNEVARTSETSSPVSNATDRRASGRLPLPRLRTESPSNNGAEFTQWHQLLLLFGSSSSSNLPSLIILGRFRAKFRIVAIDCHLKKDRFKQSYFMVCRKKSLLLFIKSNLITVESNTVPLRLCLFTNF